MRTARLTLLPRCLLAAVAFVLVTPAVPARAASDPLGAALARVTAATKAAAAATAAYDAAESSYYSLIDDQTTTHAAISRLQAQRDQLADVARQRAVEAYTRGGSDLQDVFGSSTDVLDAARRATFLDRINARDDDAIRALSVVTSGLHDKEATLRTQISDAQHALATMKTQERASEQALRDASTAANQLRVQLAAQKRQAEYSALLAKARRDAQPVVRSSDTGTNSPSSGGTPGQIIGHGAWVCPVQGPLSFTDTYGSPRSGGRRHHGNDIFAPAGTPLVAVTNGSVFFQGDPLGGNAAYLQGVDGNTYYYAHLRDYVGGARTVKAGELIGHLGNTGDATDAPPQLHFEIRPGGPRGAAIDPYSTLAAHCL